MRRTTHHQPSRSERIRAEELHRTRCQTEAAEQRHVQARQTAIATHWMLR